MRAPGNHLVDTEEVSGSIPLPPIFLSTLASVRACSQHFVAVPAAPRALGLEGKVGHSAHRYRTSEAPALSVGDLDAYGRSWPDDCHRRQLPQRTIEARRFLLEK